MNSFKYEELLDTDIRENTELIQYLANTKEVEESFINSIKNIVQLQAELEWYKNDFKGTLAISTGVGKSRVVINICNRKFYNKILLVVPTEKLRDENWKEEFTKWNSLSIYDNNVKRTCYASLNKIENEYFDLVVLDEAHSITPGNSEFFQNNKVNTIIGLTATFPKDKIKVDILSSIGLNPIYELGLDKAVSLRLISSYSIEVVEVVLDNKVKYVKAGSKLKPFLQTEASSYKYLTDRINELTEAINGADDIFGVTDSTEAVLKAKKEKLVLKRLHLINGSLAKQEATQWILANLIALEDRTLIFCGSINQADTICKNSYHSKSKNSSSFDNFKAGTINQLSCVNSISEGHNLNTVDKAIIVQVNSKERKLLQSMGRLVRYKDGHLAKVYIIVLKGTVDEKWLNSSLETIDKTNITRNSIENIKLLK